MELGHTASERGKNTNFKKLVNESGEVGEKQRETADGESARTVGEAARGQHVARAHLPKSHAALGGHPRARHRWHEVRPKPGDARLEREGSKTVTCGKQSAKDGAAGMSRVPYAVRSASKGPVLGPGGGGWAEPALGWPDDPDPVSGGTWHRLPQLTWAEVGRLPDVSNER